MTLVVEKQKNRVIAGLTRNPPTFAFSRILWIKPAMTRLPQNKKCTSRTFVHFYFCFFLIMEPKDIGILLLRR